MMKSHAVKRAIDLTNTILQSCHFEITPNEDMAEDIGAFVAKLAEKLEEIDDN